MQAIWDSIPEEDRAPDLHDEQRAELDRRLADLRANPQIGLTWEQVKARVKGGR